MTDLEATLHVELDEAMKSTTDRIVSEALHGSPAKRAVRKAGRGVRLAGGLMRAVEVAIPFGAWGLSRLLLPWVFRTRRPRWLARDLERLPPGGRQELHIEGRRMALWQWGQGPLVLLVHGWNGYGAQLHAFVRPLIDRGYRVALFDALGHGVSDGTESDLPAFARCVEAAIENVGAPRAVIAHSMGGAALLHAMLDDTAIRFERAVFIAPPSYPSRWMQEIGRELGVPSKTLALLTEAAERRVGVRFSELDLPARLRALPSSALAGELHIVHDQQDRSVPIDDAHDLHRAWPGATMTVTHGLGHGRILREPEILQLVLERVGTGRSRRADD